MNNILIKGALIASILMATTSHAEIPATVKHHLKTIDGSTPSLWSGREYQAREKEVKLLKAIKTNPENKANYKNLANLYLLNNKSAKAISAYQDAINRDSGNPKLFAAISIAYLHQSKFAMAKAMADQAVLLDPSMKQAAKIQQYIKAKEEVIAKASQKSAMPIDSTHGKK